jgi:hypothetical protein
MVCHICASLPRRIKILEWNSRLITIGIGYADRFEQFACAGQKIVMDILTRKKDVENNLGMS